MMMPKGKRAQVGDETTNVNGYTYVRTADRAWVAKHQLMLEGYIGRQLLPGEFVSIKGSKDDYSRENLELRRKGDNKSNVNSRIAAIDARIEELQAERELLLQERDRNARV
jgi:hypothetical protein